MRLILLAAAAALALSSPGLGGVLTTEAQLRQTLIGNTVSGTDQGKPYVEYFAPDGIIRGQEPEGPYTGEWQISGSQVCVRYHEEMKSTQWECMRVDLRGSRFAWIEEGERFAAQLTTGNPNGL